MQFFLRSKSIIVPLLLKETPPQRVIFMEELGQGAFGKVYKGNLRELPKAEVFFKPKEQRVEIKEGKVVAIKVLHGGQTHYKHINNNQYQISLPLEKSTLTNKIFDRIDTNLVKEIGSLHPFFAKI